MLRVYNRPLRFQIAAAIIIVAVTAFFTAALAETGLASWYRHGSHRADGHRFNPHDVLCAHKTLPLGSWIVVTDLKTRRSIRCQVLDRGPWVRGRVVDLSLGAATRLGILGRGVARVSVRVAR